MNIERELRHLKWAIVVVFALVFVGGIWSKVAEDQGGAARDFVNEMNQP